MLWLISHLQQKHLIFHFCRQWVTRWLARLEYAGHTISHGFAIAFQTSHSALWLLHSRKRLPLFMKTSRQHFLLPFILCYSPNYIIYNRVQLQNAHRFTQQYTSTTQEKLRSWGVGWGEEEMFLQKENTNQLLNGLCSWALWYFGTQINYLYF